MYQIPVCHNMTEQEILNEMGVSLEEFNAMYPAQLEEKV